MWSTIVVALALLLIFEGLMPFAAPARWKDTFRRIVEFTDGQVRFLGLLSIIVGFILLFVASLF
ncbi:MAG: DUF2065 domain-containing protein [Burkholderiaceae bacterium]|jgi:uncharacterized protein YjeT (DUF2065 family)